MGILLSTGPWQWCRGSLGAICVI